MRVLFVDDERKVLDGLRRMLHSMRHDMEMRFASGGEEALTFLAAEPYDVVVSDMRMPGMDGSILLREIMTRYPGTIRLVLSGQCDRGTVLKAVEATHQFLTKPCDPESLRSTLKRVGELLGQLVGDHFRDIVTKVTCVRSHPTNYAAMTQALASPGTTINQIGQIVAQDVGMSARVLQLTHSGFFGTPQRFTDPVRATGLFDIETIRALYTNSNVFAPLNTTEPLPGFITRLFDHSLGVARAAREIARVETSDAQLADDAYLAGLLHDVGFLVMIEQAPAEAEEALRVSCREGLPLFESEHACFGVSHAEVGAYLTALWGLPASVVQAIRLHHSPATSVGRGFEPLSAVHVANALHNRDIGGGSVDARPLIDTEYLRRLGLANRLDAWADLCHSAWPQGALS